MKKLQPLTGTLIALLTVALFTAAGLSAPAPVQAAKAPDKPAAAVGYVNRQQILNAYPGIQDLLQQIQTMRQAAQKDYDANAKDLPAVDRKAYNDKIALEEARREDKLMKPVADKIGAAIKAVAGEKGLPVIIDATVVVYGGIDITADVIAKVKQ
ncbi:OmpH family outer membrane protein [Sporomusa acidovorans]|uniref:Outer membrane protein (OmpH-like) n=1 Tax=Sporomusa acidovorans (strain ATCC 49682 / DSM 3132 / Mol) TaxID=1123286 RepID=A0ABZ3IZJ3_SPOA4|nr:OmpH family outer membrane protein [Sporomusa acidovorans]OZC14164.1 outer membrane protein (OmpH-like) [Sporomusa acidovorans DSM 3132]SDE70129.1 periplasmic chaperone for outer membrane proteins Skp [Sporomusa acidovorans]